MKKRKRCKIGTAYNRSWKSDGTKVKKDEEIKRDKMQHTSENEIKI